MKVILQQDVRGQGKKGQMIDAAEGYARNYLLPRKLAIPATADAINTMNLKEKARRAEEAANRAAAVETADKLRNCTVKITAKGGANGKLFGAITGKEISEALMAQFGLDVGKQKIVLDEPIKAFGSYEIRAKLGYEVSGKFTVTVAEEYARLYAEKRCPAMDELLYRQMPHSLEAEQAVLGSMLIDANCIKDVMEKLRPEDFYLRQNREIFETIYSMFLYSKPIDGVTVAGEMERNGTYDENTTRNYLVQLMEVTPTSANVNEYADIVRDKALLRAIATVASDITGMVQDGTGGASAVLDAAEQKIYAVRRGRSAQNMEQISVVLQGVLDHLAELSATGGKTLPGLSTGLSAVDDKINGLSKSDLILLAARPGMGKTSFALNVALNVAKASGKAVAVFSLEMSKEQLVTRVLSNEALVENGRLVSGNLRESDWVKIAEAASTLSRTDIKIDDNPLLTVADMNAKCRRIENLGLVVIDYLQLMTSAGGKGYSGENRQQAVSDISRMLKIMAKELQVPVLCLSQLSRANEKRDDKRPMLSDLRESGAIEQDADIVLFLYRDDYYNEDSEKHNIAECIIAKNRHGETGKVELRWMPEYTTFGTLERRYEDE